MPGLCALFLLLVGCNEASKRDEPPVPQSTEELQRAIGAVLQETKTPGAGVVLVSKDEVLWEAGVGSADIATEREVTPETMFRAGSISKSFVAIALLKLREQGKVRLDDRLRDLVGDVEFANPWESTDPLRLVHLLEHTSGFNDIMVREYAASVPNSDHRESLAFDPRPRTSRWRPGRFFSYSNAGYALAGYAVERASGEPFDRYIEDEVFAPLQMTTATFLMTDTVRQRLAIGYGSDGVTATPYEHILGRSSGALNVTPRELAHLVQMLLNRGTYQGTRLLEPESVARLETSATGLGTTGRAGYGLGNYASFYKGFRFQGHGGALNSYVARYAYAPDRGVGYVLMLNSGNRSALERIEKLILGYLTRDWGTAAIPPAQPSDESLRQFAGYYEPHTPRVELERFIDRLLGVQHAAVGSDGFKVSGLVGEPMTLLPAGRAGLFRGEEESEPSIAFVEADGEMYGVSSLPGRTNYRRVPGWWVWGQWGVAGFCAVMMLSAVLFALVWVPRKLLGWMQGVRHMSVRVLPLVAVLLLVTAFTLLIAGATNEPIERFGTPTVWSVGFCVLTWLFAGTAVAGLAQAVRARSWNMNKWVRRHALLVSLANVVVACYLGYWGIIGLRTWA
ncbi:MAG: serine hydrolase domain-containing protein [Pirellulales bacterium]|nr:serine hydrolase domain-containing protein [Pirellulales bacterium]